MDQKTRPVGNILKIIVIVCIVCFCLAPVVYLAGGYIDRALCYPRVSEKLGVAPDVWEIDDVFYSQLQEKLLPGMTYEEVMKTLKGIAPVTISNRYEGLEGDFGEYVYLDVCFYQGNGFSFMLNFSKDGKYEEVRKYTDD